MMATDYVPRNQETDDQYNAQPGIVVIPGSKYQREMARFERLPSKWTLGAPPENPYRYEEFPLMVYKAHRYQGNLCCMAAPPDPYHAWRDHRELEMAQEAAARFNRQCQRIVKDERELQMAYEDGWRGHPDEALEFAHGRDRERSDETAHRNYLDRNMSEKAQAEIKAQIGAHGGEHQPEIHRKPVEAPTERLIGDGRCNGKTSKGKRCSRKATQGMFCKSHDNPGADTYAAS